VSGTRLLIWDFDGALAHRRGETPAVLVRRPDPRAARYADSLAGVQAFLSEAVAA
jgi:hypothetical protein